MVGLIPKQQPRYLPEFALLAATTAYGSTFVLVQDTLDRVTPVGYILLRFAVGTIVLAPFAFARGWRRPSVPASTRSFVVAALAFGVVAFAGYWLQNLGIQRTTTSQAAFITGLFVVFTPLIEVVVTRKAPPRNVLIAVVVSTIGLFLLTGADLTVHSGDLFELGCAFMFAIWIYLGGVFSPRFDPIALTAAQLAVVAVLAVPATMLGGLGHIDAQVVVTVLITGILCSAVGFAIQLWGQRFVEPSRAAVILLFEPVVAGFVGYAVGERLGVSGYLGAVTILTAILIAESATWRAGAARQLTERSSTAENARQ